MIESIEAGGSAPPIQAEPIRELVQAHENSMTLTPDQQLEVAAEMMAPPRRTFRMKQPRKAEILARAERGEANAEYWQAAYADVRAKLERKAGRVFAAGVVAGMLLAGLLSLLR